MGTLDSTSFSSGATPASHPVSQYLLCTFLNFDLDFLLAGDNFSRLGNMLVQARWDELREKMQVVKNAYTSRHYTQCAKYGERLLAEIRGEIHPIHVAHLNFYTALSHDTLAREATLKNRYKELSLAERHYKAAIAALTPRSIPLDQDRPSSSASSTSGEYIWKFRRSNAGSFDSTSSASSATSFTSDMDARADYDIIPRGLGQHNPPHVLKLVERYESSVTISPSRPTTPEEYQFAADIAAFVRMVRGHLASVQELKSRAGVPSVRFTFPSPPPSAVMRTNIDINGDESEARDAIRRNRKTRTFRKRFDPSSVQQLCNEALAELSY